MNSGPCYRSARLVAYGGLDAALFELINMIVVSRVIFRSMHLFHQDLAWCVVLGASFLSPIAPPAMSTRDAEFDELAMVSSTNYSTRYVVKVVWGPGS